jgi:uncharacterized protein (TIGR03086 family)
MTDKAVQRFLDAQAAFGAVVESIDDDQWTNDTPDDDWDVRALVHHLVSEQLWAEPMLTGKTIADVGDALDGDLLGDDPKAAWRNAVRQSAAAFSAPGALDGTINSSMGPSPASQYVIEMTGDLIVHRWDLGRGVRQEQDFTDDELDQVQTMVDGMAGFHEEMIKAGIFGSEIEVTGEANRQAKLLGLLGRRA